MSVQCVQWGWFSNFWVSHQKVNDWKYCHQKTYTFAYLSFGEELLALSHEKLKCMGIFVKDRWIN